MPTVDRWYAEHASDLEARYEAVDPDELHAWWSDLLPPAGSRALDVGAGSGRDAGWLASAGFDVVAAEPCDRLREASRIRHAAAHVAWVDDALPELDRVLVGGARFDLILANAVLMHLPADEQVRAIDTLYAALAPHGLLVLTARRGGEDAGERGFHTVDVDGLQRRAQAFGGDPVRRRGDADDRPGIDWDQVVIRRPGRAQAAR